MPNECNRDPASDCSVSAREINDCDHSVGRIAEAKIWNAVTHRARLFAIRSRGQHNDGRVSIGRGEFVPVDIDEADRIGVAGCKRPKREPNEEEKCRRKDLKCTHTHK